MRLGPLGNGLIRIIDHENLSVELIIALWNFGNAHPNLHITNFPKGASLASSGFLISTFHRYKNCKKNFMGTPKPRSPTPLLDYTSEDIDLLLNNGGHFGRHLGFRTFRMWWKNDTLFFSDVCIIYWQNQASFCFYQKNTRNYKLQITNYKWTIKSATLFLIITLAFLGRFLYFLYEWKQEGILYNLLI